MKKLSVSILPSDFGCLVETLNEVEEAGADWIHVDVMDGHFVPNLTMGPPIIRAIRKATRLPLDVHLMVENPDDYLEDYAEAGADRIGVHVEVLPHLNRTLQRIHELGKKATVTLNPATPLSFLDYVLPDADMILLMSVNPGFSGQEFIPATMSKIKALRKRLDREGWNALLEVDGGIHPGVVEEVVKAGADVLVTGSAVFNEKPVADNIQSLKTEMKQGASIHGRQRIHRRRRSGGNENRAGTV